MANGLQDAPRLPKRAPIRPKCAPKGFPKGSKRAPKKTPTRPKRQSRTPWLPSTSGDVTSS
eukprot:6761799-Pyramimonas_sp.AAC.1